MKRAAVAILLALAGACQRAPAGHDAPGPTVDPRGYDAFYLWPGVTPPRDTHPRLLYLLDGEIRRGGPVRFDRLRWRAPQLPGTPVWLVVRVDRLDWNAGTYAALFDELGRWQRAGNTVLGLQIDFDAATKGIGGYRQFLAGLRARLPAQWQLSITGLMDWSAHGDPHELLALRRVVDEVVVQTYQGKATIPGYGDYFRQMRGFPIPFRVALVQGGTWTPPPDLRRERVFRGYVVFLLHQRDRSSGL